MIILNVGHRQFVLKDFKDAELIVNVMSRANPVKDENLATESGNYDWVLAETSHQDIEIKVVKDQKIYSSAEISAIKNSRDEAESHD